MTAREFLEEKKLELNKDMFEGYKIPYSQMVRLLEDYKDSHNLPVSPPEQGDDHEGEIDKLTNACQEEWNKNYDPDYPKALCRESFEDGCFYFRDTIHLPKVQQLQQEIATVIKEREMVQGILKDESKSRKYWESKCSELLKEIERLKEALQLKLEDYQQKTKSKYKSDLEEQNAKLVELLERSNSLLKSHHKERLSEEKFYPDGNLCEVTASHFKNCEITTALSEGKKD